MMVFEHPADPIPAPAPNKKFRSWAIIILANLEIWGWVCTAMFLDGAVYLFHGLRWQLLLRPVSKIPCVPAVRHCN